MPFRALGLDANILKAITEAGYTEPTPIQAAAIPLILGGQDLIGIAQTGTGKTAAFTLPILCKLAGLIGAGQKRGIRVLVLAPTRELVVQIEENVRAYGRHLPLRMATVFGGVGERPQIQALQSGVDIVVAFDMSGSMISEDFVVRGERVNRFNMARSVLKQFIDQRPNDRIGLVLFASQAFIGTPLTLDHDFLQANLDRLEIGAIDQNATAIGDGLSTAVNRLRDLKSKSKIIILMTDGQNNSGKLDPLLAATAAAALRVKVYTVGIGERGTAPMPVFMNGQKVGYQNVAVDVDEDTLQKIADKTGGKYYRADNAEKFQQIYKEIDQLEKTEASIKKYTQFTELLAWFVAAGLALLLLELALSQTLFRRLP